MAYGHTTLSTPDLVRSRKLSSVGPGSYLDGRPPGNTRCCKLFFFSKRSRTIVLCSAGGRSSSSACMPPLRVCPVSRHLSAGSEDGESPSEDGQSHSAESTASLCENY